MVSRHPVDYWYIERKKKIVTIIIAVLSCKQGAHSMLHQNYAHFRCNDHLYDHFIHKHINPFFCSYPLPVVSPSRTGGL